MFASEANRKEVGHRSYLTAGIAALGVGAIALSPIQPIPHHVTAAPQQVVSNLAVELAATVDPWVTVNPVKAWVDTAKATVANSVTLIKFYFQDPFPLLKTVVANQVTYLKELLSGNANLIFPQIKNNIQTLFKAPLDPGKGTTFGSPPLPEPVFVAEGEYVSPTETLGTAQESLAFTVYTVAAGAWYECFDSGADCDLPGQIAPIQNFLASHASGLLLAAVGPVLAPLMALADSVKASIASFSDKEHGLAWKLVNSLYNLINIPANMTNAFLNGGPVLDLTKLVNNVLPLKVDSFGFRLGGLLNAVPLNGSLKDPENPPTEYSGGTGYDAVSALLGTATVGLPVGLGGSMVGMGQYLAPKLRVTPPAPTAAAVAPAAAVAEAPAAAAPEAAPATTIV